MTMKPTELPAVIGIGTGPRASGERKFSRSTSRRRSMRRSALTTTFPRLLGGAHAVQYGLDAFNAHDLVTLAPEMDTIGLSTDGDHGRRIAADGENYIACSEPACYDVVPGRIKDAWVRVAAWMCGADSGGSIQVPRGASGGEAPSGGAVVAHAGLPRRAVGPSQSFRPIVSLTWPSQTSITVRASPPPSTVGGEASPTCLARTCRLPSTSTPESAFGRSQTSSARAAGIAVSGLESPPSPPCGSRHGICQG